MKQLKEIDTKKMKSKTKPIIKTIQKPQKGNAREENENGNNRILVYDRGS